MRIKNIDFIKGILIILMIIGHLVIVINPEGLLRYSIYIFHMPLFVAIGGYLVNIPKIKELTFLELLTKYLNRIIIPWAFADLIYLIIVEKSQLITPNGPMLVLISFLIPIYHLWFIPAFFSWIIVTWLFAKIKLNERQLLFLTIILVIPIIYLQNYNPFNSFEYFKTIQFILFKLRPDYYLYFALGIYLKSHPSPKLYKITLLLCITSFIGLIIQFYYPNSIAHSILFYVFNFSLLHYLINSAEKNQLPQWSVIEWMGQNSLGLYLWHLIPILIVKHLIGKADPLLFYFLTFTSEILFIIAMIQITKIKYINKYLLGS